MVKPKLSRTYPDPSTSLTPSPRANIPLPQCIDELSFFKLNGDTILHRVHLSKYSATTFNPGTAGNARFSPLSDENGLPVPTIYAGSSLDCALMETVFHDIPHKRGFIFLEKQKLANHVHSKLRLKSSLNLIDLRSLALRRLGLKRHELIDTEKDAYPATRKWACAVHRLCHHAQGLFWISRQDDSARAVMLFGDRLPKLPFEQIESSRSLLGDQTTYERVFDLAERIGLNLVDVKSSTGH